MFYTSKDLKSFGNDVHTQIQLARAIGDEVLRSMNPDYCFRGLEQVADETASYERRRRKHLGQLAVLMEQDRQYLEDGCFCPLDFDTMALRYGNITKQSKELARERAILYQDMQKASAVRRSKAIRPTKTAIEPTKRTVSQKPIEISGCPAVPNRRRSVGAYAA